jgi:SAM-dependent methyltransferase
VSVPTKLLCVVCGEQRAREAFEAEDWSFAAVPGSFRYVRCAGCGTVRADPQPDDAALARAYPSAHVGRGLQTSVVQRVGDVLGRREARRLVELADADGRALDVGCGDGRFLRRLRAAGWRGRLHGVEPSPVAAAAARSHGIDVEKAPFEEFATGDRFDLVVLRHVLEHVRDPRATLGRVHSVLRPGGLVYVATPDEGAIAARVFGRYWHGYDPPRHLWVFRPAAVRRLQTDAGFEVVEERWHLGAEIWSGSLGYAISPRPGKRRLLASNLNPLVAAPAIVVGTIELLLRRSTMYAAIGRSALAVQSELPVQAEGSE